MRARREFLKSALGVGSALLLAACNAPQASAPTAAKPASSKCFLMVLARWH